MKTYRDLIVWQKARILIVEIYKLTSDFPPEERFGLTSQMRRAVISIASNLAEGFRRAHKAEWRQYVRQAYGSASELECQLIICSDLGFIKQEERYKTCTELDEEVLRLLGGLARSLERQQEKTNR